MSVLTLRIDKYLDGADTLKPPSVPATVYELDNRSKSGASKGHQQVTIPMSNDPTCVTRLEVDPGSYYVESILPSGEMVTNSISIGKGKTGELVLKGTSSPHEWFSWQHVVGSTRATPSALGIKPASKTPTPRNKSEFLAALAKDTGLSRRRVGSVLDSFNSVVRQSLRRHGTFTMPGLLKMKVVRKPATKARLGTNPFTGETIGFKRKAAGKTVRIMPLADLKQTVTASPASTLASKSAPDPAVVIGAPIRLLPGLPHRFKPEDPPHIWRALAEAARATAARLSQDFGGSSGAQELVPVAPDLERAVYRIPGEMQGLSQSRQFAVVQRLSSLELVSLPVPWVVVGTGRIATIEIGVQQMRPEDEFCASATAQDENLGMLIGYLSSGALGIARNMADTARGMLYYKMGNPFAAAAGGYALVGSALHASEEEWHGWIRNLTNWFQYMPDGAIQLGYLRLRMRRNQADLDNARSLLKKAYGRGLPFFSMGIKWLMEGLEWFSDEDAEAAKMLRNVRQVAWRTNFQQAFTIVRLGDEPNV